MTENVDVHLQIFFPHVATYALTASVKFRTGCAKTARNEWVCAHRKSYRKYILQNIFGTFIHVTDCSCAPIVEFFSAASDGATGNRQIPNRIFGQFFTSLRKDSVANYASIWMVFFRGLDVLYNAQNVS